MEHLLEILVKFRLGFIDILVDICNLVSNWSYKIFTILTLSVVHDAVRRSWHLLGMAIGVDIDRNGILLFRSTATPTGRMSTILKCGDGLGIQLMII